MIHAMYEPLTCYSKFSLIISSILSVSSVSTLSMPIFWSTLLNMPICLYSFLIFSMVSLQDFFVNWIIWPTGNVLNMVFRSIKYSSSSKNFKPSNWSIFSFYIIRISFPMLSFKTYPKISLIYLLSLTAVKSISIALNNFDTYFLFFCICFLIYVDIA